LLKANKNDFKKNYLIKEQMQQYLFEKIKDMSETVNPKPSIKLPTSVVKIALGSFLIQNCFIGSLWGMQTHSIIPPIALIIGAFIQIGWVWDKVKKSWIDENQDEDSDQEPSIIVDPPTGPELVLSQTLETSTAI